ncbi:MAG: ATP-binding protein [Candidatus Cloacimonetes bacterium]|nr:ATP-binding protein [Candidatus Cloacimonadota bacterium]
MKYLQRAISNRFSQKVVSGKVLILLGARRVGKTELINHFLSNQSEKDYLKFNGEDITHAKIFSERSIENYKRILGATKLLVIDEAQKIPNIGLILKLIVDNFPDLKIIATGSSVFDLANKLGEPLVGRKNTLYLYPFAQMEFQNTENYLETKNKLEERMIFGSYPELEQYSIWDDKRNYLNEIVNSYLFKDILTFEGIRQADKIIDLLRLIAFQVGKEVSLQELGSQLQMGKNTVERYLDLLSKVFVIFKLKGFSRNLRKEVSKMNRWYFYDNGIRNAIIGNFNRFNLRNDVGELWENYLISERIKFQNNIGMFVTNYFWRTYTQQEIDWIEEENGQLRAYEFKWNNKRKIKVPLSWSEAYPKAIFKLITNENYLDLIT